MNIYFFTQPRNQFSFEKMYVPSEREQEPIKTLLELGYNPLVDSQRDAKLVCECINGLVWIEDDDHLLTVTKKVPLSSLFGRIYMIIYFNEEVDHNYLTAAREHFSDIFGLRYSPVRKTRRNVSYNFEPQAPQTFLGGSEPVDFTWVDNCRQLIATVEGGDHEDEVNELIEKTKIVLAKLEASKLINPI